MSKEEDTLSENVRFKKFESKSKLKKSITGKTASKITALAWSADVLLISFNGLL